MRAISEYVDVATYVPGPPDARNNITDSWAAPVSIGIYAFDPGSTSEPRLPGADRVVVSPTIYAPPAVVVGARDRVTARGLLYEAEGATREWRHPNGTQKGIVFTLRRVEG